MASFFVYNWRPRLVIKKKFCNNNQILLDLVMAISSYQIIYNRRSRSRSRSPLSTETESSTTHSLSLRDRSRFRSRESTSTSNSHLNLESLETHERANHTARRLLHLVRSFFRAKPRSRSRSRNEKVEGKLFFFLFP